MESTKSIGIVADRSNSSVAVFLKRNLSLVFGQDIGVHVYFLQDLHQGSLIDDGAVLVLFNQHALAAREYVPDSSRIIVVQRTILEKEVYRLFGIPAGTDVLVVNDGWDTTLETMTLLYKLGIRNLNLLPCQEGHEYSMVHIAITPGEKGHVPPGMDSIIDVGHRYIDISTFIEIIDKLEITDPDVNRRLLKYSEDTVSLDRGVKKQYRELAVKNMELNAFLSLSHEGILFLDTDGMVKLYNQCLARMLDLAGYTAPKPLEDVFPPAVAGLLQKDSARNELLEYRGKTFIVTGQPLQRAGRSLGRYYSFQEVTYIRQLEATLSAKLQARGLVSRYSFDDIYTQSPAMAQCLDFSRKAAASDLSILITGESGTGKELLAQAIHTASPRRKQPFVAFNCAAVPEGLMESELFGYSAGTFTGGLKEGKAGLFEQANNGTVFLDEIGDMPYAMQTKLLRVLQEQQVRRMGSQIVADINIRIVAATNKDLPAKIKAGQFREDLYYRLNVLPVRVPPLRERQEDILYLLDIFLRQQAGPFTIDDETAQFLTAYAWPGNIRELHNAASYIAFMAAPVVTPAQLPPYILDRPDDFQDEYDLLASEEDMAQVQALLALLDSLQTLQRGKGRKALSEALQHQGLDLSEGQIRRLTSLLEHAGLVQSRQGRGGCHITLKGRNFLNWLKNRK